MAIPPRSVSITVVKAEMRGMEVLARLRQLDTGATVVLAPADSQIATRDEARAMGAVDLLGKPFQKEQVLNTVETVAGGGTAWN